LKKKCLIIGLGQIGLWYDFDLAQDKFILTHSRAIDIHENFELVGGVDFNEKSRKSFEERYNKVVYSDLNTAVYECKPDMIIISTPTNFHKSIFNEIIKFDFVDTILCEKPLSYNIEDARFIVKSAQENKIALFVNYMRRCDPGVIRVKEIIDSESKNEIKAFVWYSKGIFNNGSHMINLIEFWLGKVKKIHFKSFNRLWGNFDNELDFYIEFEKGKVFFMSAWEEEFSHYTIELLYSRGRIRYEDGGQAIFLNEVEKDEIFAGYNKLSTNKIILNEMNYHQYNVLNELSKYLNLQDSTICTGMQALETLEIINHLSI
jgi:predicted dehydrogenase